MVIPRDFHVLDPPRVNLARRLSSLVVFLLERANLERADLSGANLTGADLGGAKANQDTTWPEGFDPEAAGVIFK